MYKLKYKTWYLFIFRKKKPNMTKSVTSKKVNLFLEKNPFSYVKYNSKKRPEK